MALLADSKDTRSAPFESDSPREVAYAEEEKSCQLSPRWRFLDENPIFQTPLQLTRQEEEGYIVSSFNKVISKAPNQQVFVSQNCKVDNVDDVLLFLW